MALSQLHIEVKVNEGVLWVGGDAYPLRTIARVGQRILEPDKKGIWKRFFLLTFLLWFFAWPIAAFVENGSFLLFALQAWFVWRLVSKLTKPTLYGLVVNSSGSPYDAVWSMDSGEIDYLVDEVTKAIGHPDIAQVTYNMQHAVVGDVTHQYGAGSIGKAEHRGSGNIGSS